MIKDTNYFVVPGFAVNKLNLKGNSLMLFSIIYGFSQGDNGYYNGSLQYLEEWTNSTRQAVIKSLNKLIETGIIIKEQNFPNNKYKVNNDYLACKQCLHNSKLNLQDSKQSLQNNIDNNISNNIDNKYLLEKSYQEQIDKVISYLNSKCSTNFKSTSSNSKRHIKARLKEGYKFDDFKDVIDSKWDEWGKNPVKFSTGQLSNTYLRPSTLFGSKFEEYLQAAWMQEANNSNSVKSSERSTERSNIKF